MRQLIAGNWKMHMLRGPATELATAVATRRPGPGLRAAGLSAVHGRSSRSPVCWQDRRSRSAARTATPRVRARIPAMSPRPCCAMPARPGSSSAIPSAGRTTARPTNWCARRSLAAVEAGLTPIVCVGETEDQRSCRSGDRGGRLADRRQPAEAVRRRGGLRAGLGDRHRQDRDRAGRRHDARLHPRGAGAPVRRRRGRRSASCMAGRCGQRTPARCSPCRMSAAG